MINVEAQVVGCPVIASSVGGIPEYLAVGKSSLLFKNNDFRDLATKIDFVLSNENIRQKMIIEGEKFAKRFDWDVLVPNYLKMYNEAINGHGKKDRKPKLSGRSKQLYQACFGLI